MVMQGVAEAKEKDTEIVLGAGKLLAIFFALVALCGVFFGLGYSLGKNSGPITVQDGQEKVLVVPGTKPVAGTVAPAVPAVTSSAVPAASAAAPSAPVEQTPTQAQDTSADPGSQPVSTAATTSAPATATAPSSASAPAKAASQGPITVQVAAVSKPEDAQALVDALRKKNYPVFVAPNASTDSLFHVQVGPFTNVNDAEAMRSKLADDGYNAIVKK